MTCPWRLEKSTFPSKAMLKWVFLWAYFQGTKHLIECGRCFLHFWLYNLTYNCMIFELLYKVVSFVSETCVLIPSLWNKAWWCFFAPVASAEVMLKKVANSVGWVRALGWSPSSTRNPIAAWQGLMRETSWWGSAIAKSFLRTGLSSPLYFHSTGVSLAVRWGVDSVASCTLTYIYIYMVLLSISIYVYILLFDG